MKTPADQFTNNGFVDKMLKIIPQDPLTQAHYMYLLTLIVFVGLTGYAGTAWWDFFTTFSISSFFRGMFMLAIGFMSLFGLKQTRSAYLATKAVYGNVPKGEEPKIEIETPEEMLKSFTKTFDKMEEGKEPKKRNGTGKKDSI